MDSIEPQSADWQPLLSGGGTEIHQRDPSTHMCTQENDDDDKMDWAQKNKWIVLAVASGACAAFNGVFAKL